MCCLFSFCLFASFSDHSQSASLTKGMQSLFNNWREPATISKFQKMEISFNLEVKTLGNDSTRIPILCFVGNNVRLVFYLNGWGEFGIMHYDKKLDANFEYKLLFGCNLDSCRSVFVRSVTIQPFPRVRIVIPNERVPDGVQYLLVNIDRYSTDREIKRHILPHNQSMNVWWGGNLDGTKTMTNLIIKVVDEHDCADQWRTLIDVSN